MSELLIQDLKKETNPFIKAEKIHDLIRNKDWQVKDLAKALGCKPAYISHFLRLRRLPEIVIDGYLAENISLSHLFVLSRLKKEEEIIHAYEKILAHSLTVAQTEALVRELLYQVKTEGEVISQEEKENYLKKLPKDVSLKIIQTRIKSKLIFEIKGSLKKTTQAVKLLLERLTNSEG